MTNGAGSPANTLNFFSIIPDKIIEPMPMKYADAAILVSEQKQLQCDRRDGAAPENRRRTGFRREPHGAAQKCCKRESPKHPVENA